MEFKLANHNFQITPQRERYNELRRKFVSSAGQAANQFEEIYKARNHSLDDVVNRACAQFEECLQPVLKQCIELLVQRGVLTIDIHTFYAHYEDAVDVWTEAYGNLVDQYAAVVMTQEQLSEYRTARRENRGRFVGGGFGLGGAVKGMVTAGALNMASGAAHGIVNFIGEIASDIKADSQKNRIFNDPETLRLLRRAAYATAFNCHLAVIDCINRKTNDLITGIACGF